MILVTAIFISFVSCCQDLVFRTGLFAGSGEYACMRRLDVYRYIDKKSNLRFLFCTHFLCLENLVCFVTIERCPTQYYEGKLSPFSSTSMWSSASRLEVNVIIYFLSMRTGLLYIQHLHTAEVCLQPCTCDKASVYCACLS